MNEKIVLIDGHSILNRAFYGVPDLTNSQGVHTNAVYGFLNIMLKILEEEKTAYLAVAFDVKQPTFRHEMYAEYKGKRKPMPEELRQQVPLIQEVLRAMQVPVIMQAGYEADDILGTIAIRAQKEGMDVTLVSGDRDLLQLASEHILIRLPKTKYGKTEIENYHDKDVVERYGITPEQVIDIKGLMGDASDNIPGVPGIGEKTAKKLLALYPSLEDIYKNLEQIASKRTQMLLSENRELAFLSKQLATIRLDCPISFSFQEARKENLFTQEAFAWIKQLELKSLEKHFDASMVSAVMQPKAEFQLLEKKSDVEVFVSDMLREKPETAAVGFLGNAWTNSGTVKKKQKAGGQLNLVFDDESMDISAGGEEDSVIYPFYGLSFSYDKKETVTVCMFVTEELPGEYLLEVYRRVAAGIRQIAILDWKNSMHLTAPLVTLAKDIPIPNQEAFADSDITEVKRLFGQIFDISIGAYLLNPLNSTYYAEDIARDFLGETIPSYADLFGKRRLEEIDFLGEKEQLVQYLGNLSYVAYCALPHIRRRLEDEGMEELMEQIEMPTAYYLYQMEREGVHADRNELQEMSKLLESRIAALETDIYDLAGEEFNINSPKQLGVILFEKLKLPYARKTKTGYSTSAEILEKLKQEDPIVEKILEYRQVSKLKSTYADGLSVFIEKNERIHGKFNQTITATGRISSTDPNLQNIPIRMELGREIRKVFQPKSGCVFLDADYSQIELRVLAHLSGDEEMLAAYRENQDIHRSTASKVFHTPYGEVTDLQRRNAKAVNFGIVYGISAFGLGQDLNISKKEAQAYIDQYFSTYPAVKAFIDSLVEAAKKNGYAVTLFGRRRPVPELQSSNYMQRSFGERIAMNSPIQGTAADIIKIAMIRVANRLKQEKLQSKIVLQVHDELLVETPLEEKETVAALLQEEMEHAVALSIPLKAEVTEGKNWKEAH